MNSSLIFGNKYHTALIEIVLLFVPFFLLSQNHSRKSYEGYYLKYETYPEDATNWWMYNGLEVQGVTHDDDNWYFTLTFKGGGNGILRRIPRSVPLASGAIQPSNPGIKSITMQEVPELAAHNYWHWGDPDHYRYDEVDYILIPIPGPIIACFRASDLAFINYAHLDGNIQDYAGWCAVNSEGNIYTSSNHAWGVLEYEVDWPTLLNSSSHNALSYVADYPFHDINGSPIQLLHMQGGEFTPSDELLYVVCGSAGCLGIGPGQPEPSDGIHVFETNTWKDIKRSTNTSGGNSHFNYTFDNSCACFVFGSQTPEGLTIWDLDDGSAPFISGQLHVIVDHYNIKFCDDAITMQHFGKNIYVDKVTGVDPPTTPLTGTITKPFKSIESAYNFYPVWDGAQLIIKPGIYSEVGIFDTRIFLKSQGSGSVIIGQGL